MFYHIRPSHKIFRGTNALAYFRAASLTLNFNLIDKFVQKNIFSLVFLVFALQEFLTKANVCAFKSNKHFKHSERLCLVQL